MNVIICETSIPTQPPNEPSIHCVTGPLSAVVKRLGCEANNPSPCAEVKNGGAIHEFPHTSS
jgi:hypothetical protein